MKFSRLRTLLLACCFGIAAASAYARINGYLETHPVMVPPVFNVSQVKSETLLIIRLCPEPKYFEDRLKRQNKGEYAGDEQIDSACYPAGGEVKQEVSYGVFSNG